MAPPHQNLLLLEHVSAVHFLCGALNATNGSLPSRADQNFLFFYYGFKGELQIDGKGDILSNSQSRSTALTPESKVPPLTSCASGSATSTAHQSELNLETKTKLLD